MPLILIPTSNDCAYIDEEKADAIASSLELQFERNASIDKETEREDNESISNFLSNTPLPPTFRLPMLTL